MLSEPFEHLVDEGKREVILSCRIVELAVVNTNSPTGDYSCLNQFVVVAFDYGCSFLLGHHMNGTHPFAIRDRVNDTCIKKFDDLFLHHLLKVWVESSLRFNQGFVVIFYQNAMHAEGRVDSGEVFDCVPNGFPMRPKFIKEFFGLVLV